MVVAAPGSQTLISLLPRLFPQSPVAILTPTYGEYAPAFAAAGSQVLEVESLDGVKDAPGAVLCNPNNPDGRRFDAGALIELLGASASRGLVLVDESFADLEDRALSLAPLLPQRRFVVLRSLSKSYGLGGLRLGFALAAPDWAAAIRAALGPWPVSGPAIAIGLRALGDRAWLAAAREQLTHDVTRLDAILQQAGLALVGGTLLFRLGASADAAQLFDRLGQAGVLVRRFDARPSWLRFGIPGSEDAWRRLGQALV